MITLTSDFGTPYPAAMRGVILSRTDARLVDVAHDFPRGDVRTAAFWLREVLPWFPPAVHLAVIDPGVGTDRPAVVVTAGEHALVGPDNGLLLPAARRLGEPAVYRLDPGPIASDTFHGRDVFAPGAAAVHDAGIEELVDRDRLTPTDRFESVTFPDPDLPDGAPARGEVLVVDGFGNAITNLPGGILDGLFGDTVAVNGAETRVERSYAHVADGERLVTVGSHGSVELAVNGGRGDEAFGVGAGDAVELG